MQTFIGLLRGINVGGHKKLPMADLKSICGSIGLDNTKTYIQSGNLVFGSEREPSLISKEIEDGIEDRFGFRPPVLLINSADFQKAAEGYPFSTDDHKHSHLMFLSKQPAKNVVDEIRKLEHEPDLLSVGRRVIYFHFPNGVSGTRIDLGKLERTLKVKCTMRNWRTVQQLIEMAS